ncbi:MAG TPA: LysR substrate-binding domain-containing protein [Bradyrhizobium sp.]|nr:LysR substrate-binding domain-containing protein [Bradyrhizobium sp.]
MTPIRDLNNLYFFAQVVDFGSYTAAAKALGLQTSKLSRRIAALESELGVRLINRTTRRLSLTEAGKTFHRHCLALLDEAQAAKDAMGQLLASPQGLVRISCPTGLLQGGIANILARFLATYPQVRIALDATNRRVDVIDEGLDIAIRVRKPPWEDSDLTMRAFGPDEVVLVASPKLIAAHSAPQRLGDVARIPTLSMASADERPTWRFVDTNGKPAELTHAPRLFTDDLFTLRRAVIEGIGAALVPLLLVADDIERGALVRLLPSLNTQAGIIHAVFPSRRGMVPAVRALLDFLAETIETVHRRPSKPA